MWIATTHTRWCWGWMKVWPPPYVKSQTNWYGKLVSVPPFWKGIVEKPDSKPSEFRGDLCIDFSGLRIKSTGRAAVPAASQRGCGNCRRAAMQAWNQAGWAVSVGPSLPFLVQGICVYKDAGNVMNRKRKRKKKSSQMSPSPDFWNEALLVDFQHWQIVLR